MQFLTFMTGIRSLFTFSIYPLGVQLTQLEVDFHVQWLGRGSLTLDNEDCKNRLKDEINRCVSGGESIVADCYFR